jgi:frizzled protein 5/8
MTLTTFLIDTKRFKYPERPIVFLSACYLMVSIGYLTRVFLGHEEVACDDRSIKYSTAGPNSCTLIFLLIYFFGMASSIWWVVLSFTWFLAAGLKWGNEAITKHSQYLHLAAWLIPTIQSLAVIHLGAVDADPVSGICYVGNLSSDNLRTFVLAPLFVYLVIGTTFLMAGFVSLFRIRSVIKQQGGIGAGTKADKLEKLMIRIGIFSVLYTVPATIVIGCYLYETSFSDDWNTGLTCPCLIGVGLRQKPIYALLMLKYFMALAVGITSGVWIWSGKTVESWRRLWKRIFGPPDQTGANQALIKQKTDRLMTRPYVPGANDDVETVLESLRRQNHSAPAVSPSTIQMLEQHLLKSKHPISHV